MDALQSPIPIPQGEVIMRRALGRQVLRQGLPLAAGREHVEDSASGMASCLTLISRKSAGQPRLRCRTLSRRAATIPTVSKNGSPIWAGRSPPLGRGANTAHPVVGHMRPRDVSSSLTPPVGLFYVLKLRAVPIELGPLVRCPSRRLCAIPRDNLLGQIDEGAQARGHVAAAWIIQAISRIRGRPLA
jgi:hypothetical protein